MSWFWKFSCTLAIVLASFGYFVHRPIPADVPNQIHFQVLVDYLSAVESAVSSSKLVCVYFRIVSNLSLFFFYLFIFIAALAGFLLNS